MFVTTFPIWQQKKNFVKEYVDSFRNSFCDESTLAFQAFTLLKTDFQTKYFGGFIKFYPLFCDRRLRYCRMLLKKTCSLRIHIPLRAKQSMVRMHLFHLITCEIPFELWLSCLAAINGRSYTIHTNMNGICQMSRSDTTELI